MLASVLKSKVAVAASVRVVRAFVQLRELISANVELARKFSQLERRLDTNDAQIKQLFDVIREMLEPSVDEKKPEIGFHVREEAPRVRARKKV